MRSLKILVAMALAFAVPAPAFASSLFFGFNVGLTADFGPPPLPVYVQPPCPAPNFIWNPGYWAWGEFGYYWVPGTWVAAPRLGYLWTPGYWGFENAVYVWHGGYWGPHVGYYGGINYGFGYFGRGYGGGDWDGDRFRYNVAVTNVNTTIVHDVYINKTVINNYYTTNNVSYNGGPKGVIAEPTVQERRVELEQHVPPTALQQEHTQVAARDRSMLATVNSGRPLETAVTQPYSARNLPAHFAPVRPEDKAAAQRPIRTPAVDQRTVTVAPAHVRAAGVDKAVTPPSAWDRFGQPNGLEAKQPSAAVHAAPGATSTAARKAAQPVPPDRESAQPAYRAPAQPAYRAPARPAYRAPANHPPVQRSAPPARPASPGSQAPKSRETHGG